MKFKCTSCQHVFEHETDQKECFCPKCGNLSTCCPEEEHSAVCSECGTEIPVGATVCPTCGCPVTAAEKRHCEECGAELDDSAQVCPQCGCPVPATPPQPVASVSAGDNEIPEADSSDNMDEPPYYDETATDDKKKYYIIGGSVLAAALLGLIVWYFFSDKFKSDSTDPTTQYTVLAENLTFRSSPSAIINNNVIAQLPYGTELKFIAREGNWAEVEVQGEHGYVGWRYILPDSTFRRLSETWDTVNIREIVDQNRCRLAVLDYINRHSLETGAPYWQINYTGNGKGKMPNNVAWPDLKNMYDKYPEFAFIIENGLTHERRIAIYSFDSETEEPILIYDDTVEYEGMIQDIRLDRRGNLQVSFTGNRINSIVENFYDDEDPGCATLEEIQTEEPAYVSQPVPEEIVNTVKATELQIVTDETDDEPITPAVDQSKVYSSAEVAPKFPGGDAAMMRWISEHLRYPAMAQENNIQGRVVVQFTVSKTGKPYNFKIVRGKDPDLDREALRVVRTLPDFIPGTIQGVPVDVTYSVPITFRLQGI